MTLELLSAQVRSFLAAPGRHAVIATLNPDGMPWQSVIWYLLHDDGFLINSRLGRRWPANLLRDGRVNFASEDGENAVTISGNAEVFAEGDAAQQHIAEMARLYYDADHAERSITRFRTEPRITFLIRPRRVYVHGDPR